MIYIVELIKGILLSVGFIIGMVLFAAFIVKKIKEEDEYWEDELLLPAFEKYLTQITRDEQFEQIEQVKGIIEELRQGNVPDAVDEFDIKTEKNLMISYTEGNSILKVIKEYKVIRKETA